MTEISTNIIIYNQPKILWNTYYLATFYTVYKESIQFY